MNPPIDAERRLRELSFLHEVAQLASSARDWDEMLRIVIDRTTDAMRVEVSSLYLLERREGVLRLVATNGLNRKFIGKATLRVGEGITGWVANARVPAAVRQVRADPRFKWVPGVDEERFTSMLSVPLLIHDEVVGVVNVQSVAERGFDLDEIEYLQTIANLVAGIIEKGRLQREAERKLREVSALFEVSNILTSTLELDEVLSLLVARLVRVYPGSAGAVFLRDGDELRERARSGEPGKAMAQTARQALNEARPIVAGDRLALPLLAGERLLGAERTGKSKVPIDEAVAQVGRLDQLVDHILNGVRQDKTELVRPTRFELRAAVAATLAELAPVARRHRLIGPRAGSAVWVRADRRRVGEVLAGLVHNATKYAPERTRITARIEKGPDRAIVRVSDEGPGVPPHERPRLFEPYARGDHTEVPGTGIGLFAARGVVEALGGDIWYEESKGATFAFSVPLDKSKK